MSESSQVHSDVSSTTTASYCPQYVDDIEMELVPLDETGLDEIYISCNIFISKKRVCYFFENSNR